VGALIMLFRRISANFTASRVQIALKAR
jgi:hypothetical protein